MPERQHRIHPVLLARAREFRQPQTPAEATLWASLRDRQLGGYKFRRQHPIDRFIADFCCPECHLIVEVDGDSHLAQAEYDVARTEWLSDHGYEVVRFTNREVRYQFSSVLQAILDACLRLGSSVTP